MRKTKDVEIFGNKLKLSERNAQDVLNLAEYAGSQQITPAMSVYISAVALSDSLKYGLKWYQRILKKYSAKKLLKGLTQKEIFEFMAMILEIEGVDNKKKVVEKASEEALQDA